MTKSNCHGVIAYGESMRRMSWRRVLRIVAAFGAFVCVIAPSRRAPNTPPNLSGRWVMNLQRSHLPTFRNQAVGEGGGVHIDKCCIPKAVTETIDHQEPALRITLDEVELDDQGIERPHHAVIQLTTDNRADDNNGRSRWEFEQLVTVSGYDGVQVIRIRSLSSDRRTLTEDTFLGSRQGQPIMTLVFDRREE